LAGFTAKPSSAQIALAHLTSRTPDRRSPERVRSSA
jgi:hypothetical protein